MRDMPVSTAMWTRSVVPSLKASAENASASFMPVTAWVMLCSVSAFVYSPGVWPRIRIGMVIPPRRSSSASSRQATAR